MAFDYDDLKVQFKNRVDALLTQSVYGKMAPENATYPFAVINFLASSNIEMWKNIYYIDIDLWDNSNNTTTINDMATTLQIGLHGYWYAGSTLAFRSYIDSNSDIPTNKPDLSRINQRYRITVF